MRRDNYRMQRYPVITSSGSDLLEFSHAEEWPSIKNPFTFFVPPIRSNDTIKTILNYIKKETVLFISLLLALASAAFVPPDNGYLSYIDFHTLTILLSLMIVMAGLRSLGIFSGIGRWMLERTSSVRSLALVLVMLCFGFSMFITNDVALIVFVPFAIDVL